MRTTLDIDEELLDKVVKITGEKSKGRAVDRAMEELIKRDAVEKLLAARGMFPDLIDRTQEWEDEELRLEEEHRRQRGW